MRQNNAPRTFRPALYSRDMWRVAIVIAILLASAYLAYRTPPRQFTFILVGAGPAVAAAVIYIKRPALGLLALVFSAMLVPFIGTTPQPDIETTTTANTLNIINFFIF